MTLTTWAEQETFKQRMPQTAEIRLPQIDEVVAAWPVISALLLRSTRITGCYEPIDLLRLAMAGQVGIWLCLVDREIKAAVATEIKQYPRKRILEMLFVGGSDMKAWLPALVEEMDRHANAMGCDHIASVGRKGWIRAWGGEINGHVIVRRVK